MDSTKEAIHNFLEEFSSMMEHNTRGEEILTYGVASIALLTAVYKIRPFSKFKKPSDVPRNFFSKKVLLDGKVKNVEPGDQPLILVDHKPPIPLPRFGKPKYLPLKIAGVNITGNGLSWLQTVVKEHNVKFLPISRDEKSVICIVLLPQRDKKSISLGQELVKVGFGTVQDTKYLSVKDKDIEVYKKSLQLAQKWAERKRNGVWQQKYSPTVVWKIRSVIDEKLKLILPVPMIRYFNI